MATVTVKLVRRRFGNSPKQRGTLAALGLKKIRQERSFEKTDAVLGQIAKVKHLVEVTES